MRGPAENNTGPLDALYTECLAVVLGHRQTRGTQHAIARLSGSEWLPTWPRGHVTSELDDVKLSTFNWCCKQSGARDRKPVLLTKCQTCLSATRGLGILSLCSRLTPF